MNASIVISLIGKDRIGIVDEATGLLLDLNANIETSRMIRLGGEFAMLMLVSLPAGEVGRVEKKLGIFSNQGFSVTINPTQHSGAQAMPGWHPFQIEVQGADHEGIVHEISHYLSGNGINIESMETDITQAPESGAPLFTMTAQVLVPPSLNAQHLQNELREVGNRVNVDVGFVAVG